MCTVCNIEFEKIRLTDGFDDAILFKNCHSCYNEKNRNYCECGTWIRCDESLCLSCTQKNRFEPEL